MIIVIMYIIMFYILYMGDDKKEIHQTMACLKS